jgi:hypothetical protein
MTRVRLVSVLVALFLLATACSGSKSASPNDPQGSPRVEEGEDRGGAEEAEEQQEGTLERTEAQQEAIAAKEFGKKEPIKHLAAAAAAPAAFGGELPVDVTKNDWEPAIAADPAAPWVYILTTRYGEPKPCPGNCPTPFIALLISSNGGQTYAPAKPLCACKGSGQFDPIIEVVPNTGAVYAVYMNGFNVVFVKSTNHGQTWSAPVSTYGNVSWNDKPVLATSDDGRDVYVSWNGPNGGDAWVAQSHDFGVTWTQTKVVDSPRYFFAYDADVLPNGTVVFAESSIDYSSGSGQSGQVGGVVQFHALVSSNAGQTWTNVLVDTVEVGEACVAAGCTADFYLGHSGMSADQAGNLVFVYDGATTNLGLQQIFVKRSTNGGLTWGLRTALSVSGEEATAPSVEQTGTGDARLMYYQTSGGGNVDAWNVWYRRSTDGGVTWGAPVRLSDATSGAGYKTAAGFLEVYGDYGEIAVTNTSQTLAVWSEGFSYNGPGGAWTNRGI